MGLTAVILAAGVGARLGQRDEAVPKALLRFGGMTLLARHIANAAAAGVAEIALGVGYRAELIAEEVSRIGAPIPIRLVGNPHFRDGSMVTLHRLAPAVAGGNDILLMDADVLYHPDILSRLVSSPHRNCLLMDRDFEPGDEPVKICVRGGAIVDFRKQACVDCDFQGESVGFFRFSAAAAANLARIASGYVDRGERDAPYEEAVRDLLLAGPAGEFGWEDITGLPWIEIDFPEDVTRAEKEILPRIPD